jgi:hypothetical protein
VKCVSTAATTSAGADEVLPSLIRASVSEHVGPVWKRVQVAFFRRMASRDRNAPPARRVARHWAFVSIRLAREQHSLAASLVAVAHAVSSANPVVAWRAPPYGAREVARWRHESKRGSL